MAIWSVRRRFRRSWEILWADSCARAATRAGEERQGEGHDAVDPRDDAKGRHAATRGPGAVEEEGIRFCRTRSLDGVFRSRRRHGVRERPCIADRQTADVEGRTPMGGRVHRAGEGTT